MAEDLKRKRSASLPSHTFTCLVFFLILNSGQEFSVSFSSPNTLTLYALLKTKCPLQDLDLDMLGLKLGQYTFERLKDLIVQKLNFMYPGLGSEKRPLVLVERICCPFIKQALILC